MSDPDVWTVEVRQTPASPVIATVPFMSLMFTEELNDVGGGSVTFDLDADIGREAGVADVWEELLENPNIWLIKRNGEVISAFSADAIQTAYATPGGDRGVTVSGKGLLAQLERAAVLPPNAISDEPWAGWENDGFYYSYGLDEYLTNGGSALVTANATIPANTPTTILVDTDAFPVSGTFMVNVEDADSLYHEMSATRLSSTQLQVTHSEGASVATVIGADVIGRSVFTFHHFWKMFEAAADRFANDSETFPPTLPEITLGFTRWIDSQNQPWVQRAPDVSQENGGTLLDLLAKVATGWQDADTGQVRESADYRLTFNNGVPTVLAARNLGQDKSRAVVFFDQAVYEKARSQERADIQNVVVARTNDGTYAGSVVSATSASSRRMWGRRETMITVEGDAPKDLAAVKQLRSYYRALSSWTVAVPPQIEVSVPMSVQPVIANRVFEDYTVGDWIGVGSDESGSSPVSVMPLRVAAISGAVDSQGVFSVEVTLDSVIKMLREVATDTRG